jgi:hypothetical protein
MEVRICLLLAVLLFVIWVAFVPAHAANIAKAQDGESTIFITDEKCHIKGLQLPLKAIYRTKDKDFLGCVGQSQTSGMLLFFFEDGYVFDAPPKVFQKLVGV